MTTRRTFIRQTSLGALSLGVLSLFPEELWAAGSGAAFPRSTPEAQGVDSAGILRFIEAVEKDRTGLHSLMIVRHGHVVAEGWWKPYAADLPHMMYSVSKSFTSTAVGLAVAEGRLTVEDKVISFFPNDHPAEISENLAAMRVRDLLTMSTGHEQDTVYPILTSGERNWAKTFLAQP
ncbi:MAG: class A beta-lactamase-related serine hydrolase, partial [Bacteroidetes bacterium]